MPRPMERLGIALGSGLSPTDITDIVESVRLTEQAGYESAWIVEGHGGEQFSILTACALATRWIRLGTAISSVFVQTAPTIAMAAACLL
jgi:alkanesulfonate monooxygenase SsuD/methylene tetrahydromethanopterin reductase-like flavin-dependent oxidoreductase (luciferase family)